jgi:stage II sporulation protein D
MSTRPFRAPATPSVKRWVSLAAVALPLAAGCAPREPVISPTPPPTLPPAPQPPAPPQPPPAERVAAPVSVGLVVDTAALEVRSDAAFTIARASGETVAQVPAGGSARFTAAAGGTVDATWQGRDGAAQQARGLPAPLLLRAAGDGLLAVGANAYRGELRVQRAPSGRLTLVNRLDMESYLLGVVPREIGRVGDDLYEASRAQAVAARTYAISYLGRRSAQGFDVFATVEDQVYGGVAAEHEPVSRAVRATFGEILTHGGRPINAYYHSTCAGRTAAIEEVWNSPPVPYLVSVVDVDPDGRAYDHFSSRFQWTERWTHAELAGILNRTLADSLRGRTIRRIDEMRVLQRTPSGRIASMRLETDAGTFNLGRDRIRWILTPNRGGILNSSKFDVRLVRQAGRVTEIVAEGGGWGHGIGMCQVGAMGRARAGQDYRTILSTYYPGTQLVNAY